MIGYFYILECADGSYYCGSTRKFLDVRVREHQQGVGANHTSERLPVKLVYQEVYPSVKEAFRREHQVKKWNKEKKVALINGDLDKLKKLAKKKK